MIVDFKNKATEEIFNGINSKISRKLLPIELHNKARSKLDILNYSEDLNDLKIPPSNFLEKLKGDRKYQHSIRINLQFRICFNWNKNKAENVEITDYH